MLDGDDTQLEEPWPHPAAEATADDELLFEPWLPVPSSATGSPEACEEPCSEDVEAAEEQQVDRILSRLHAHGMDSLTSEERQLLQRVSARYRSRLGRHT